MRPSLVASLVLSLAACGGGGDGPTSSGVDPTTPIAALTTGEVQTFCAWAVDQQGGPGHMASCGDTTITTQTEAECEASLVGVTCTATVADFETCLNAIDGDPCKLFLEESCAVFFECAG